MKLFIKDTKLGKYVYFSELGKLVEYLSKLSDSTFNQTRKQFMQTLIDLGHGYDDPQGVTFTRAMAEHFDIGIVNNMGAHVKCDVHTAIAYNKEGYGH